MARKDGERTYFDSTELRGKGTVIKVFDTDIPLGVIGLSYLTFAGTAIKSGPDQIESVKRAFSMMPAADQCSEILNLQEKYPLHCYKEALFQEEAKTRGGKPIKMIQGENQEQLMQKLLQGVEGEMEMEQKQQDGTQQGQGQNGGKSEAQQQVEKMTDDAAEMLRKAMKAIAQKDEVNKGAVKDFVQELVKEQLGKIELPKGDGKPSKCIIHVKRPDKEPEKLDAIVHPKFPIVLALASARIPTYMVGPAGSGKSTIAHQVARALEMNYHPMSFNAMMSYSSVFGFVPVTGEGYQGTPFREAYEKGGVCLWDEMDAANANIITAANMATSNGLCPFPDKTVDRHKDFVLLAGANTFGRGASRQYVGRNALDSATLDRFAFVELDYDAAFEESLMTGENRVVPEDPFTEEGKRGSKTVDLAKWIERVRKIRDTIEKLDVRVVLSPRVTLYGKTLLSMGMKQDVVENALVWWKMDDKTRARVQGALK